MWTCGLGCLPECMLRAPQNMGWSWGLAEESGLGFNVGKNSVRHTKGCSVYMLCWRCILCSDAAPSTGCLCCHSPQKWSHTASASSWCLGRVWCVPPLSSAWLLSWKARSTMWGNSSGTRRKFLKNKKAFINRYYVATSRNKCPSPCTGVLGLETA